MIPNDRRRPPETSHYLNEWLVGGIEVDFKVKSAQLASNRRAGGTRNVEDGTHDDSDNFTTAAETNTPTRNSRNTVAADARSKRSPSTPCNQLSRRQEELKGISTLSFNQNHLSTSKDLPTTPAAASSSLSPPLSQLSPSFPLSGGSRKRKRASISDRVTRSQEGQSSDEASSVDKTQLRPASPEKARESADATGMHAPTSSLSRLSTTPATYDGSQTDHPLEASQNPPASSLSLLSTTPVPFSQRQGNVHDSQSSDELSEGDVYEKEKPSQTTSACSSAYCAPASDSDDAPLENLGDMLGTSKKYTPETRTTSLGSKTETPQFRNGSRRSSPRASSNSKYSLKKLLQEHQQEQDRTTRLDDLEAALDARATNDEAESTKPNNLAVLARLADEAGDQEQAERIRHALERQDLLTNDILWHFFRPVPEKQHQPAPPHIQLEQLGESWSSFHEKAFCEQAFLSGFTADALSMQKSLPPMLVKQLWETAIYEPREDLSQAYRKTLEALSCSTDEAFSLALFTAPLKVMGATREALTLAETVRESSEPMQSPLVRTPPNLYRFLRATQSIITHLSSSLVPEVLLLYLRMGIDQLVNDDHQLLSEVQAVVSALIKRFGKTPGFADLGQSLVSSVTHPVLQRHILSVIPEKSALEHDFKRRLALTFFLASTEPISDYLDESERITNLIVKRVVENPLLDPYAEAVDYRSLIALITILDTGIGAGFGPPREPASDAPDDARKTYKNQAKHFDSCVSSLSIAINSLYTRIQDAGATHMLRTTAKSTIQNLVLRLDYGVRTTPPPRLDALPRNSRKVRIPVHGFDKSGKNKKLQVTLGDVTSAVEDEHEAQAKVMERFLAQKTRMNENPKSPQGTQHASKESETSSKASDSNSRSAKPSPRGSAAAPERDQRNTKPAELEAKPAASTKSASADQSSVYQKFLERKKKSGFKSPLSS
ncbi:MAG: hypothetical protein Q9159_004968 [Coniocarpon cinnabarinum]